MAFVATELRRDVAWKWVESGGECKPVEGGDGVKRGTAGSVWAERGGMGAVGRMRNGGEKGYVAERRGEAVDRRRAPDGNREAERNGNCG